MATRGETLSQVLPSVAIVGATSGSFTVNPLISTSGNSGTVGVTPVDHARIVKHEYNRDLGYPVITGDATITITASGGTQVHYSFNGRNPTSKAVKTVTADATAENARTNHARDGAARVYSAPILVENSRPGDNLCEIRIRAYKISASGQYGISPNEKSQVMIIRFVLNNTSF